MMSSMPRLTHPSQLPEGVSSAIDVMGNRARTEILRQLATHGPSTLSELAEGIEATRQATHGHVRLLERLGVLEGDLPPEQRRGRTVRWRANEARVRALVQEWLDYVAPGART